MSGSAGGNRISRKNIKNTVKKYKKEVLSKCDIYISHVITGSYIDENKKDFGDIDLVVCFKSDTKQDAKKVFIDTINGIPNNVIVPFRSVKYNGRKYLNTGEIITVLYPIVGEKGYVQIDNIVSLSLMEQQFKHTFLSYPAPVQGLMLGLIKTVLVERSPKEVMDDLNIPYYTLKKNEEYEFTLSSSNLTLWKYTYSKNYKMLKRVDMWVTKDWKVVDYLLKDYDINNDFDYLLEQVKHKLKKERSKKRVKGIFKSMVSVKSGEVGTYKGNEKNRTINEVEML